jgi:hypothetical protein
VFGRLRHAAQVNDRHKDPQIMQLEATFDALGLVHRLYLYRVRYPQATAARMSGA